MVAIHGFGVILLSLETLYIPLHMWRGRHVTCRGCRVGGKPLWCLWHDPHTETEIKSARVATLTHTNMMPSVSLAALQTTYPLSFLTLPSSAISFVFGEMQCSGPREKVCVWVCVFKGEPFFFLLFFPILHFLFSLSFQNCFKDLKQLKEALLWMSHLAPFIDISLLSDSDDLRSVRPAWNGSGLCFIQQFGT